ncbi:MAG: hypothetical protein AB1351_04825 [Thermoproteota archaeon]
MIGRSKPMLSIIAAATAAAVVAVLSVFRGAFAASANANLPPEYAEILRLAKEKVSAATQPDALGNGIPVMSADMAGIIAWVVVGATVAIGAVAAAKFLTMRMKGEKAHAQ